MKMSYLLFMDESGHDHKTMPYEVRGGFSIASVNLFKFIQDVQKYEQKIFGCSLSEYKCEIKGEKLLRKDRFKWAKQGETMPEELRQKHVRRFLGAALEGRSPRKEDFTAYGQASIKMVDTIFNLLSKYNAKIFATISPRGIRKPEGYEYEDYLRRDHIRLMAHFATFLERNKEDGLLIMDQCERNFDKKFKRQLSNYFLKTPSGRKQAQWIVPEPFFIESGINYMIQIADVCIYAINTGFRRIKSLNEPTRPEIQIKYERTLEKLQYEETFVKSSREVTIRGIVYVEEPYLTAR